MGLKALCSSSGFPFRYSRPIAGALARTAWKAALLLACIVPCEQAHSQAVIEGRVDLKRGVKASVVNQRYATGVDSSVVAPDPPAAVVWIEGPGLPKAAPGRAVMAQKDLSFATNLLPVQVGTTVDFPNQDKTYHNVFSYSKTKRFDLGRYLPDEKEVPSVLFDKPGAVALHCDIHEHMQSVILVVDSPCFVKTGTDGSYRLAHVPPGHFTIKAWLDSRTTVVKEVDIPATGRLEVNFP